MAAWKLRTARKSNDLVCPHCRSGETSGAVQYLFDLQAKMKADTGVGGVLSADCPSCGKRISTADFPSR
jgi:hypothetical protein